MPDVVARQQKDDGQHTHRSYPVPLLTGLKHIDQKRLVMPTILRVTVLKYLFVMCKHFLEIRAKEILSP